jgi:putative transcriptional regulator
MVNKNERFFWEIDELTVPVQRTTIPYVAKKFGSSPHGRPIAGRFRDMKMQRVKVDPAEPSSFPPGRVDKHRLDETKEEDIKRQQKADDVRSMRDAARFARRVRKRLGLTQAEFSRRIDVSLDTIKDWEQGRLYPTGPAKALLKLLDRMPETALSALD